MMSGPSSPSPSSGSDDFMALLDAELQTSLEELGELSREEDGAEEEGVDVEADAEEADGEADEVETWGEELVEEDVVVEEEEEENEELKTFQTEKSAKLGGKRKREEEEDGAKLGAKSAKGECPPHPGFMWGVCIRCGENRQISNSEPEPVGVALRYIHEGLEVTEREAARMRQDELKHVMLKGKLYLVLDLDHTMLNSARFIEVPAEEEAHLAACYSKESSVLPPTGPQLGVGEPAYKNGLHRLNQLQMWTKIRPFAHDFLQEASKMFEMYVYTMGERAYALAMARLLDPTGRFFGDRVISQGDSTRSTTKDLDVVLGAESAVVILDDTEGVWPKHRANLILMERYHFFRSSCRQFGLKGSSLTERRQDESEKEGMLATALKALRGVHNTIFSAAAPVETGSLKQVSRNYQDVRKVIHSRKRGILKGCRVVFSRIFPIGMPYPEAHPFWRLTAELGAHCSTTMNAETTHIIALDRGTDKARWAHKNGKFLVHPSWVDAAQYLWCRPREEDFPVGEKKHVPTLTSLVKTVDVEEQNRQVANANGTLAGSSHTRLTERVESITNDVPSEIKVSPKSFGLCGSS